MCLAVPARIISTEGTCALVEMNGVRKEIDISLVPDVGPDDWVIVHVGFALQKIDPDKATQTLKSMELVSSISSHSAP